MVEDEAAKKEFLELLRGEEDLVVRTDDNFLLRHLRAAEGDPKKAFAKLKQFYELKRDNPEWFASEPPEFYEELLAMGSDYILENRDPSGKRIWIHKPAAIDASKTSIKQQACMHDLMLEMILDEDETQCKGMIVICDLKDFPWSLLRWMTPHNSRIASKKADSLPFPRIEYHVINPSLVFTILFKAVYPFLTKKQKECIFNHGDDLSSLHKAIDPSCLPEEYGGSLPNVCGEKAHQQIYEYKDKLMVNLGLGYKTAPEKAEECVAELTGPNESTGKLEID